MIPGPGVRLCTSRLRWAMTPSTQPLPFGSPVNAISVPPRQTVGLYTISGPLRRSRETQATGLLRTPHPAHNSRAQHVAAAGSLVPAPFSPRRSDVSEIRTEGPLSLDDSRVAFGSESAWNLFRHVVLLTALRVPGVAARSDDFMRLAYSLLGRSLTNCLLRATIFRQFCGGETLEQLQLTARGLAARNLGCIVDYAAERGVSSDMGCTPDEWTARYRTYKMRAISIAASLPQPPTGCPPCVAVKVSGCTSLDTLRRLTAAINFAHKLYDAATSGAGVTCLSRLPPILQSSTNHEQLAERTGLQLAALREWLQAAWPNCDASDVTGTPFERLLERAEAAATDGVLDFHVWREDVFAPEMLVELPPPRGVPADLWPIKEIHQVEVQRLYSTLEQLTENAQQFGVRLLYDAEEAVVQPAIDAFVQRLQKRFNSGGAANSPALVYGTYQMYLKDGLGRLRLDCRRAEAKGYKFGVKVVRGAYMVHESRVAADGRYSNPVAGCIEDTHCNFDSAIEFLINREIPNELLCGTHNERSVQLAVSLLTRQPSSDHEGESKGQGITRVTFAQLLGMGDHISMQLAAHGFATYKYVPFGAVDCVLPYLVRRAQENSSLIGGSSKECSMMWLELRRRCMRLASALTGSQ